MHELAIIQMLVYALTAALVLGWLTQRLGFSPLVGYLVAGVLVGPYTPGFVANHELASQLAEMGVILLLFGVGLHFHPGELIRVWRVAVPGAIAQSALASVLGWWLARLLGWSHAAGMVLGMSLAVASTVVLSRMLVERQRLDSREGQVAIGWLIVEDIFTVVALVVLPALAVQADGAEVGFGVLVALLKVSAFALVAWFAGRRVISPLLEVMARTRQAELFTLAVFVVALGVALIAAEVFHVSVALGAFFAGLVVGQSRVGVQAAVDVAPFRDVFSALFFVSVGMLVQPSFILKEPLLVGAVLAIVMLAKPAIAWVVVRVLRHPKKVALTVSVGLAQIGEFSFILAGMGRSLGVLPETGFNAIVTAALFSIAVNPLLFRLVPGIERKTQSESEAPQQPEPVDGRASVVVAGFGPIGRRLCEQLQLRGVSFVVVDQDLQGIEQGAALGYRTCYGDAGSKDVLEAAALRGAGLLVLADLDLARRMRACVAARALSPGIRIVSTIRHASERGWLEEFGAAEVVEEDRCVADALLEVFRRTPMP
jgi:CPA2 family monovalent cation:H+ antiporter-2